MFVIYCVQVLAIYENPGVTPTALRTAGRDSDFAAAQSSAAAVGRVVAQQPDEYMETFAAPSRYGAGWRCRQWVTLAAEAATLGNTLWTRLQAAGQQPGTDIRVFPRDETQPVYTTGPISFKRSIPAHLDDTG